MWTCYPPMHFSVHIIAHILQKQLLWPKANTFFFFCSWKQRLVCELCKARDSTSPGDKTRTCSLFTAAISFDLAAVCRLDRGDLQCYHFITIWSKMDCLRSKEQAFLEYNVAIKPHKGGGWRGKLVNTTPRKKLLQMTMNFKNRRKHFCPKQQPIKSDFYFFLNEWAE